jgi:hypothetical protein
MIGSGDPGSPDHGRTEKAELDAAPGVIDCAVGVAGAEIRAPEAVGVDGLVHETAARKIAQKQAFSIVARVRSVTPTQTSVVRFPLLAAAMQEWVSRKG